MAQFTFFLQLFSFVCFGMAWFLFLYAILNPDPILYNVKKLGIWKKIHKKICRHRNSTRTVNGYIDKQLGIYAVTYCPNCNKRIALEDTFLPKNIIVEKNDKKQQYVIDRRSHLRYILQKRTRT